MTRRLPSRVEALHHSLSALRRSLHRGTAVSPSSPLAPAVQHRSHPMNALVTFPPRRPADARGRPTGETLFALLLPLIWALVQWLGGSPSGDAAAATAAPQTHQAVVAAPQARR